MDSCPCRSHTDLKNNKINIIDVVLYSNLYYVIYLNIPQYIFIWLQWMWHLWCRPSSSNTKNIQTKYECSKSLIIKDLCKLKITSRFQFTVHKLTKMGIGNIREVVWRQPHYTNALLVELGVSTTKLCWKWNYASDKTPIAFDPEILQLGFYTKESQIVRKAPYITKSQYL